MRTSHSTRGPWGKSARPSPAAASFPLRPAPARSPGRGRARRRLHPSLPRRARLRPRAAASAAAFRRSRQRGARNPITSPPLSPEELRPPARPQREERGSSGRPLPAARGRGRASRAGRARSRRGARSSRRDYLSFRVRPSWAPARGSRRCGRNVGVLQDEWQEISPGASPRGRGSRLPRTRSLGSEPRGRRVSCGLFLGRSTLGPQDSAQ